MKTRLNYLPEVIKWLSVITLLADPSGHAIYGVGLRPFACRDCGLQSRREHGCLCIVSAVCCQVGASVSSWSLLQGSPKECGVSECDREVSKMRRPWPTRGCSPTEKISFGNYRFSLIGNHLLYSHTLHLELFCTSA